MSDPFASLDELWQSQATVPVNPNKIKQRMRWLKIKHWCYVMLDCLALLPIAYFLFWEPAAFTFTVRSMLVVLGVLAISYTVYLSWLRRVSLFWQACDTTDYLMLLQRQLVNSVRIARATKHSAWVTQLLLCAFFAGAGLSEQTITVSGSRLALILAGTGLALTGFYAWAQHRQRRFERELLQLKRMVTLR
ncbi:hypothetical protein [Salinimonas sediminis]|uniref:Uncharacterized protein n=1 Tax=Salinimonas sediminis TaxID=2303538 RepID=A0A346NHD5_9ALTE|nr:hypothetical protein [Salinimonas sediminis]AXR04942.1 hypothetical protein D0Y50_00300 [Salinimonas sediminis]